MQSEQIVSNTDNLLAIFTIDKLRDLKKHCRGSVITQRDLADFIMWCTSKSDAPFLHSAYHRQFVPEHLELSKADLAALAANGVGSLSQPPKKRQIKCSLRLTNDGC
jgi:hypothetical protein